MTSLFTDHPVLVLAVLKTGLVLFVLLTAVAYLVWFERKVIAHIQSRWGPYRVGPHGLLQPLADGLKFLFKEDLTLPTVTSRFVFLLAPFLSVCLALVAIAVIPFGPAQLDILGVTTGLYIADINIGLLFVLAVTSLGVYSVALAGWASNSKYPLLGGLRSSAQMISYELVLTFAVIGPLLLANTLSLQSIIEKQAGFWYGIPRWYVFPQFVAFLCFFIGGLAETNRVPFDLPEAETELVAGFHTEYSSMKFAMFFMGEYAHMITTALIMVILFFGGWLSPFPSTQTWQWTRFLPPVVSGFLALIFLRNALRLPSAFNRALAGLAGLGLTGVTVLLLQPPVLEIIQGPFWLLAKAFFFLFVFVWTRATLPRFRYDQLMAYGWKLLVPAAVLNVIVTSFLIAWMGKN